MQEPPGASPRVALRGFALPLLMLVALGGCAADTAPVDGTTPVVAVPASLQMTALRAMQQATGHAFVRVGDRLAARVGEPGGEARAEVAGERVAIVPRDGSFSLALRTMRVGRDGDARATPSARAVRADGQEVVIAREGIEERYLAGPLGLEQSFGIEARAEGHGPLVLEVCFDGLQPQRAPGTESLVLLLDEAGATRAVYRDLAAMDATGRDLPARIEVLRGGVRLVVDDAGASYPIVVDPLIATQQASFVEDAAGVPGKFGHSVSLSGDIAVVGAPETAFGPGAAYVFVRSGATWSQQAKLVGSDSAVNDEFGVSVSVSGDTAIIGAERNTGDTGAAYVFVRSGATWSQQAKLVGSDSVMGDSFGSSVTVSGDVAAVGAPAKAFGAGAAYVFVRSGATWSQQAKLTASDLVDQDFFGYAVGVSADTVIVGAGGQADKTGAAYVFSRTGTSWSAQAKLTAGDAAPGDYFGASVSLLGDTALVGAPFEAGDAGAAYVFARTGPLWTPQKKLTPSDATTPGFFGASVSMSGNMALVGAWGIGGWTGAAYVFARTGASWEERAKLTQDDALVERFGSAVGLSGGTAIIAAESVTSDSTSAVYLFSLQKDRGEACDAAAECASGFCADGVCCDAACDASACQACSVAAGATMDGTCTPLTGTTCDAGSHGDGGEGGSCRSGLCAPSGGSVTLEASGGWACHVTSGDDGSAAWLGALLLGIAAERRRARRG